MKATVIFAALMMAGLSASADVVTGEVYNASSANGRCGASSYGIIFSSAELEECVEFCTYDAQGNISSADQRILSQIQDAVHTSAPITLNWDIQNRCIQ